MIKVGTVVLNEKLIKFSIPCFVPPKDGSAMMYPVPSTKIVFLDNSEMIFEGMDCNCLFSELESKIKM